MRYSAKEEQQLMEEVFARRDDLESLVRFLFPWGQAGTPLERYRGPKKWQTKVLRQISENIRYNKVALAQGKDLKPLYLARSSGRGIGKSALFGMLIVALMSAQPGITIVVTANTEDQLRTRTMAELGKWHSLAINTHWFEKSALSLHPSKWFGSLVRDELKIGTDYFYAKAQSWSEENPDAFAGIHSDIGTMLLMDEASGIAEPIWNVSEGFFTDQTPIRVWAVFSNPRRSSGAFFECFHANRNYWDVECIDSRTVEGLDYNVYQRIADKYGEDHDVTRVEVKGEFPRLGANQFIGTDVVTEAMTREVEADIYAPMLMGVDVARFGDDSSVICLRQGRNADIEWREYKGRDTMELANEVTEIANYYRVDAIFVDGGGVGGGVVDRLKELGYNTIEVQFGSSADEKDAYYNKRTEMWARMKDWLERGVIPNHHGLKTDLTAPEYKLMGDSSKVMLEKKEEMKKRGYASPDRGDALALTFAKQVARKNHKLRRRNTGQAKDLDYDMFT